VGTVTLRDVTEEDLPVLFEHQQDPDAARMAAFPTRPRDAFFEHWRTNILGNDAVGKQTILFDGRIAGSVLSFDLLGQPAVGYWLGREFWGKGIATRALAEFLGLVETRPLYARVAKHNVGSIRVLEKCGFEVCGEGTFTGLEGEEVEEFVFELKAGYEPNAVESASPEIPPAP
jgi:RimJ/RimL family protein N-acetyltransferase